MDLGKIKSELAVLLGKYCNEYKKDNNIDLSIYIINTDYYFRDLNIRLSVDGKIISIRWGERGPDGGNPYQCYFENDKWKTTHDSVNITNIRSTLPVIEILRKYGVDTQTIQSKTNDLLNKNTHVDNFDLTGRTLI